jgi:hypothetical protein
MGRDRSTTVRRHGLGRARARSREGQPGAPPRHRGARSPDRRFAAADRTVSDPAAGTGQAVTREPADAPREGREEGLPSDLLPTSRVITPDGVSRRRLIRRHENPDWSGSVARIARKVPATASSSDAAGRFARHDSRAPDAARRPGLRSVSAAIPPGRRGSTTFARSRREQSSSRTSPYRGRCRICNGWGAGHLRARSTCLRVGNPPLDRDRTPAALALVGHTD